MVALKDTVAFAPALTRLGLSVVFLWFGMNQLFAPDEFMGYLPNIVLLSEYARTVVILNGVFETAFGLLLAIGLFTRPVALVLGVHLLVVMASIGYGDIMVRDFGLACAAFAVFLGGGDRWCLDVFLRKIKK